MILIHHEQDEVDLVAPMDEVIARQLLHTLDISYDASGSGI